MCSRGTLVVLTALFFAVNAFPATNLLNQLLNEPAPGRDWRSLPRERLVPVPDPEWDATPRALLIKWRDESTRRVFMYDDKDTSIPPRGEQLRILAACEQYPSALPLMLEFLDDTPEIQDAVYSIYQAGIANERYDTYDRDATEEWLMRHGKHLRSELVQRAGAFQIDGKYIPEDNPLKWLAELDWPTAKTILQQHATGDDFLIRAYALTLLRNRAEGDERARLRNQLIAIAENKDIPKHAREEACEAVLNESWNGRDDWFIHILKTHPPLSGCLAQHVAEHPDRLIPVVTPYIGGENLVAHTNAVLSLRSINYKAPREDSLRPLLPWLKDPSWLGRFSGRLELLRGLEKVRVPESYPGLIWMLAHDYEFYHYEIGSAADALAFQRATNAIPHLRKALERKIDARAKERFISAIYELGGFSLYELTACVEIYVADRPADRETPAYAIGSYVASNPNKQFDQDHPITPALLFCANEWEATQPDTAHSIREIVSQWSENASDDLVLDTIQNPHPTVAQITDALNQSDGFRKRQKDALDTLSNGEGLLSALATAIQKNAESAERILRKENTDLQIMLLACARLNRMELPINLVEQLYDPKRPTLSLAVDRYLEANDTPPARRARARIHPNKRIISGARFGYFDPGHTTDPLFHNNETRALFGLDDRNPPDETHVLFLQANRGYGYVINLRGDTGEVISGGWSTRHERADLTTNAVARLRRFVHQNKITELPALTTGVSDGRAYEYAYLTPTNGSIVYINNPRDEIAAAPIYSRLVDEFMAAALSAPMEVRYHGSEKIAGFEILHPGTDQEAKAVWSEGGDTRVLLNIDRETSHWHSVTDVVGDEANQPNGFNILGARSNIPKSLDYFPAPWKCATPQGLIRTGDVNHSDGLWMCSTNDKPVRLLEGKYKHAITSANGKWIIAKKNHGHREREESLILFDLMKRAESRIPLPKAKFHIISYMKEQNVFLISTWDDQHEEREFVALDPETKETQTLDGEFWPLENMVYRPLQAFSPEGLSWAAKYDQKLDATVIGLYDTAGFTFHPHMRVPTLHFTSMDMWVNEEQQKVYLTTNGDLLRFTLQDERDSFE